MFKLLHNCTISHTCKIVLQILQARLQQYVNRELPDVQAGFRKGRGTRIKWPTIIRSSKKQESSRKTSTSALLTMPKPLTVWISTNCGNLWKRRLYQTTWPASWEICIQVRKQQLELDMEQTGPKWEKEYAKAVYCYPTYLTYMQSTSWEMLGWMIQAWIKIAGEISQIHRWHHPYGRKWRGTKEPLIKVKEESEKVGLKFNIQKTKITASSPIISWQIDGETMETLTDFLFLDSKITADGDYSHEIKRPLLLGRKTMITLDSILKSRDITLLTQVHLVKAIVFPVVKYECESWTIKNAELWRIDAFELWCWRRLLTVLWTARKSKQCILKEINPE